MKTGAELITEERARQISQEEWSDTHDDLLEWGDLADAAEAYIRELRYRRLRDGEPGNRNPSAPWPWDADAWKPTQDPIRQLVKAGALIAAEIDRLQRAGEVNAASEPRLKAVGSDGLFDGPAKDSRK